MSNPSSSGPRKPRDTERHGQGQSGYGAGRHGEDPAQHYENRNESYPPRSDEKPAGPPGMGLDDRFTGRGGRPLPDRPDDHPDDRPTPGKRRG